MLLTRFDRLQRRLGLRHPAHRRMRRTEIATQRFQREALALDFGNRSHAQAPQERDGWAPSLDGMLQQEHDHNTRQNQKRRSTNAESSVPASAKVAAFASRVRSISHS